MSRGIALSCSVRWTRWRTAHLGLLAACALVAAPAAAESASPNGVVALLTDYGEQDFYVGALKGAVLSSCLEARLVDLSHDVPAYDVRVAAWQLWDSAREFPPGTVFVAIVDPGVGTGRRPVVLETAAGHWFVGPDNGLFTVVERAGGPGVYREITRREWMRPGEISASFHGRDIFGPAAGRLACGAPFESAGAVVVDPVRLAFPEARVEGNALVGDVLFADRYGNLQTNIAGSLLESIGAATAVEIEVAGKEARARLARTYGDVPEGELLVLTASTGRIEIARNMRSVAEEFGAKPGSPVVIRRAD